MHSVANIDNDLDYIKLAQRRDLKRNENYVI